MKSEMLRRNRCSLSKGAAGLNKAKKRDLTTLIEGWVECNETQHSPTLAHPNLQNTKWPKWDNRKVSFFNQTGSVLVSAGLNVKYKRFL